MFVIHCVFRVAMILAVKGVQRLEAHPSSDWALLFSLCQLACCHYVTLKRQRQQSEPFVFTNDILAHKHTHGSQAIKLPSTCHLDFLSPLNEAFKLTLVASL